MALAFLKLRYEDDGDGMGKLLAAAQSGGFAGEGGAYFNAPELEQFARAIAVYPLSQKSRPSITGGFGKQRGRESQEHLAITVYPIGKRGHVGVQVRLATEVWWETRSESQRTVRLEIVTTYEPLAQFSGKMIALVRGTAVEAILSGEESM